MCVSSFFIKLFSEYVGEDKLGNKYYLKGDKRYVIYKGLNEPSKVPPVWHAWLHHLRNDPPKHDELELHSWQKPHMPNLTGTKNSYQPTRKLVSSDYQPWRPN